MTTLVPFYDSDLPPLASKNYSNEKLICNTLNTRIIWLNYKVSTNLKLAEKDFSKDLQVLKHF